MAALSVRFLVWIGIGRKYPAIPADWDTQRANPWQLHPRLVTGGLDAEPGKNPGDRPCEHYWDRQPHGSAKQRRVNLSGDDDIRNQRERGGNQHGPLAWIVGIRDCNLIHGVKVNRPHRDTRGNIASIDVCRSDLRKRKQVVRVVRLKDGKSFTLPPLCVSPGVGYPSDSGATSTNAEPTGNPCTRDPVGARDGGADDAGD
jgi:hypothetical protein